MPTARPRYQVTETEAVERALDRAARQWPGETRSKLILRLIEQGAQALGTDQLAAAEAHRRHVESTSGGYSDAFPEGYLKQLREDWPA